MTYKLTLTYKLTFPDGTVICGFAWSPMGWYFRCLPDSGIHSAQLNYLHFTPRGIEDAGIKLEKENG